MTVTRSRCNQRLSIYLSDEHLFNFQTPPLYRYLKSCLNILLQAVSLLRASERVQSADCHINQFPILEVIMSMKKLSLKKLLMFDFLRLGEQHTS